MTRFRLLLAALLATAVGARAAHAQSDLLPRDGENFRSEQRFAFELRLGPYSPEVDEEFHGEKTPYKDYFGTSHRLMTQFELDYQFFHGFGSAAVGVSVGYFRAKGKEYIDPGAGLIPTVRSDDITTLSLFPFAVVGVYRADQLWKRWHIPVAPYGKLGLNYTIWSVYDGNGLLANDPPAGKGRGGTLGWQGAVGLSLIADIIDLGAARELDSDTGINHTSFFFELAKYEASGLGQKNRLHVGDTTWLGGIMFEF